MRTPAQVRTAAVVLALLGAHPSPGLAQGDAPCIESEGPFAGSYATLSVADGDGSGLDAGTVLLKRAGFANMAPAQWTNAFTGPPRPVFTRAALFEDAVRLGCSGQPCGVPTATLDIDAFSAGLDIILANPDGTVNVTGESWGGLVFSVSPGTQGAAGAEGQAIRDEVAAADGAAGDLFTYILDGPNVRVPPRFVDRTMRSQDSTEMGLGPTASGLSDIDGVDLNMVAFRLDPLVFSRLPGGPRSYYFSVSTASSLDVPACWWNGSTASGATVLRTIWSPLTRSWSCPEPAWLYTELGLASTDELTALAVDEQRQFILFSTTNPLINPLMFYDFGNDSGNSAEALAYAEGGGMETEVSEKLGLQITDVIDAVCSLDPGPLDSGACVASIGSIMFAQLLPPEFAPLIPYTLNSSGFRSVQGTTPVFKTYMIGWPPPGIGGESLFLHLPTGITFFRAPRNTTSGFCGGPQELVFNLPSGAVGPACIPFSWFAVGPPFRFIDLAAAHSLLLMVP